MRREILSCRLLWDIGHQCGLEWSRKLCLSFQLESNGTPYAPVEKVAVDSTGRYFAFHVEDEGVKADLSWNETPAE